LTPLSAEPREETARAGLAVGDPDQAPAGSARPLLQPDLIAG
jgi:hypothetical protein